VARGIVRDSRDTLPAFTYFKSDTFNRLVAIPKSQLPMYHSMIHGASNDSGKSALTDSIVAVRIHLLTATRDSRTGKDALRTVESLVRLMNAGLLEHSSCGQPPLPPGTPVAVATIVAGAPQVSITWTASVDDNGGEKDSERYAIYRMPAASLLFGDPIASIPSKLQTTYNWIDKNVVSGQQYIYGVSTQDCTPANSAASASLTVTVP
jgi:hypothetical protein